MAVSYTTAYNLTKPEVGASEDQWGDLLNADLDTLDSTIDAIGGKTAAGTLKYADAAKLATTSTGVDVTGTVTADGLTVDGDGTLQSGTGAILKIRSTDTDVTSSDLAGAIYFETDDATRTQKTRNAITSELLGAAANTRMKFQSSQDDGALTTRMDIDSNGDISFYEDTGTTAKLFWDASAEALGIGTTASLGNLTVGDGLTGTKTIALNGSGSSTSAMNLDFRGGGSGNPTGRIGYSSSAKALTFHTGDFASIAERMRINASGNLLVGGTDETPNTVAGAVLKANGIIFSSATNAGSVFNRLSTDGAIIGFRKDGTTVGSIGTASNGNLSLSCDSSKGILFGSGSVGIKAVQSTNAIYPANPTTGASVDNAYDIGFSTARFDDIYATNGTIQTSDANEKQQIAELTAAEMQAAKAISKLFKTFKWNDSVAEKGDDARIHSGVIAQEVEAAMTAAGLDAGRYAFFISSTWWESTEVIPAVEAVEAVEATYDEEGNILTEAIEAVEAQPERTVTHTHETAEEAPIGAVERTRKGIRYPQLLAFVGAATEQRLASIEARLDAAGL